MRYRAEAASLEGFVQQIACSYLRHGYWFYVTGQIPPSKDPRLIDERILTKYGIAVSESTRARRKRAGNANLQYLRFKRQFIILATKGEHRFFQEEKDTIRDIREQPLRIGGYSISYRRGGRTRAGDLDHRWHSHVQIDRQHYLDLRARLLDLATHRSAENLALEFYRLPFEPYSPIRRQMLRLLRDVNAARKTAGFREIPL
jgi:hypothetical protein